jgi:ATP-dependent Lhr-like helicase
VVDPDVSSAAHDAAVERQARTLLERYGVVFRRLLDREPWAVEWRRLLRVYWRLEARGDIRGGRFVSGVSGQQFALPSAVERLRETRRAGVDGRVLAVHAIDPLNLTGVLTSGERIRAVNGNRIAFRDGVPIAALEGDYLRPLRPIDAEEGAAITTALVGRRLAVSGGFVGRHVH